MICCVPQRSLMNVCTSHAPCTHTPLSEQLRSAASLADGGGWLTSAAGAAIVAL